MKKHKPIILFCPASVLDVINQNVNKNIEYYVYIIHYILKKPANDKRYKDFVPIDKKKLNSLFNCLPDRYVKFLEKYELIESDKKYIPKKKALYYRINPKHKSNLVLFELQPDKILFKGIINSIKNQKSNFSKLEPHLYKMANELMNVGFDIKNALKWLNTIPNEDKKPYYSISINLFYDKRFRYFKRNITNNRLDTNLTNLKKEFRQFIKGNYVSIDLKNSQPFLLSILIQKITDILQYFYLKNIEINLKTIDEILNNKHLPLCLKLDLQTLVKHFDLKAFKLLLLIRKKYNLFYFTNLSLFKKWVVSGIFYDEFIQKFDGNLSRDEAKQIMFEVLFSQTKTYKNHKLIIPYQREKKIFADVFPVIFEIIEALKEKQHNKLAIYLQKLESNLFIDITAKELVKNGIVPFTIHDSFLIPAKSKDEALNIIKTVFEKEIGIIPAFSIEKLHNNKVSK